MSFDSKEKHLEFIQSIIKRMASNSFMLKGWAVTLIAGIFALSNKDSDKVYFLIAYIPLIIFWGLDSYYLQQERLYRALYDTARKSTTDLQYSLKATTKEYTDKKYYWLYCVFSKTEVWFYFPLALLCAAVIWLAM